MDNERQSFVFYRSFFEAIKFLPKENKADVFDAICEFALNQNEIELEVIPKAMFTLIKPQLEANIRRYENGKKGAKAMQEKSKAKANRNQTETKPKPNVNVNDNVNVNVNVEERKNKFFDTIKNINDEARILSQEELKKFGDYWVEKNPKGRKMRFEKEKVFDISRRLKTWSNNTKTYGKEVNNKRFDTDFK